METLLILGAGPFQRPLIQRAVAAGHEVIAVDRDPTAAGLSDATRGVALDFSRTDAVLDLAREHAVAAVASTATDLALPALAHVAAELCLPGPSREAARLSADKLALGAALSRAGVPTPCRHAAGSLRAARRELTMVGLPAFVKPPDAAAGRGISRIAHADDLPAAFARARAASRSSFVCVEEELPGYEFGVQAVVANGRVQAVIAHNDLLLDQPAYRPVGHSLPARMQVDEQALLDVVERSASVFGLANGVLNVDLIDVNGEIHVLEATVRLGASLLPELIEFATGIDLYAVVLLAAQGTSSNLPGPLPHCQQAAAARLCFASQSGLVAHADPPPLSEAGAGVVIARLYVETGDAVSGQGDGTSGPIGGVVTVGSTLLDAEERARSAARRLAASVRTQQHPAMA